MSNRSRAQRPATSFLEKLREAAETPVETQGAQPIPEPEGQLPRPNTQDLGPFLITWHWAPEGAPWRVQSVYSRGDQTYVVIPWCAADENGEFWNGGQAKLFGEALLAAWQWEYTWQTHVGEFLVGVDPKEDSDGGQ